MTAVSLLDLKSTDCRWLLDQRCDRGLMMYCGELRAHRKTSYCPEHHAIVWMGYQPRRKPKPVVAIAA